MSRYELDAKRMLCPMPVIKTQNMVKNLAVGDILDVICTDPGALSDIPAWAKINGHEIVDSHENDDEITITVRVGS
jgi:tRNA 2-thiouridine synthesizing protein A